MTHGGDDLLADLVDLARKAEARDGDGEVLALLTVVDGGERLLKRHWKSGGDALGDGDAERV